MEKIEQAQTIYSVGHSNHRIEEFINLPGRHGITAIADARSAPFSRHYPQFNQDVLSDALDSTGIVYVFLGKELGARPNDPECYDNGYANFERMAETPIFKSGIERLLRGREKYRIALLCAEKEPLECHRTILVCRNLRKLGVPIKHILADGATEEHQDTERRLVRFCGLENNLFDMALSDSERLEKAYIQQARKIAYKSDDKEGDMDRQSSL